MGDNTRRALVGLFVVVIMVCLGTVATMSYGGYIRTNAVGEIVDVTVLNKQIEVGDTLKAKVSRYKGRVVSVYLLVDSILDLAGDE